MSPQLEVQLLAAIVAAACALPGVFLVLRRTAMISDAISHTILFGIVIGFLLVNDIESPWLLVGATLTGVLTVWLVELVTRTGLVKEDTAIGLIFPLLFSLAVIAISRFAANAHLDVDAVLLGEIAFAPFDRLTILGIDLPRGIWITGTILLANLLMIGLFYKELKLSTFDAGLAAALGFSPVLLHYGLMTMVSLTAVGSFDAVGSILVIALMIGPPAAAYLLTDRLSLMLGLSVLIGVISAIAGYWLARWIDTTIAGAMATMVGISFGLVFLLAPQRGMLAVVRRQGRQRWEFAQQMLTAHLLHHEGQPEALEESQIEHLISHLRWNGDFAGQVVRRAEQAGLVRCEGHILQLTEQGRALASEAMTR
ncbi:MAG: metal ABC transporter permease [Oscillochloris sp.]|nr:metal ABC transporter permease [Oscillochloris sp.]